MYFSTDTEYTSLFIGIKGNKKNSLLTAFLFKPSVGYPVQWLPEDIEFSRTCSPLITEVNIHTFGEILILYSILMTFFQV